MYSHQFIEVRNVDGERVVVGPTAPICGEALHGKLRVDPRLGRTLQVGLHRQRDVGHNIVVVGNDEKLRQLSARLEHGVDAVHEHVVAHTRSAENVAAHVGELRAHRLPHQNVEHRQHRQRRTQRVTRDVQRSGTRRTNGGVRAGRRSDHVLQQRLLQLVLDLVVRFAEALVHQHGPVGRAPQRNLIHFKILFPLRLCLRAPERHPDLVALLYL